MRNLLISFVFISCLKVHSQTWSLETCINYAYENRIELKVANLNSTFQSKQSQLAKQLILPDLNSEYNALNTSGRNPNINTNKWEESDLKQISANLSSNLVLYNGLQNINKILQHKALLQKYHSDIEQLKIKIRIELTQAYFEALLAKANMNISQTAINSCEKQIKNLTELVVMGKKSKIDLLELKAFQENNYSNFSTQTKQYQLANNKLQKAMNHRSKEIYFLEIENNNHKTYRQLNLDSIYIKVSKTFPTIQSNLHESVYYKYLYRGAKGKLFPKINLFGTYSSLFQKDAIDLSNPTIEYGFKSQFKNNRNLRVGLTLSMPIYNKSISRAYLIDNELNYKNSIINQEITKMGLYYDLKNICD